MLLPLVALFTLVLGSTSWKLVPLKYTLVKDMDKFEVRKYPPVKIATADEKDNDFYDIKANTFVNLYKYIGGENDRAEQLDLNLPLIDQIVFGQACHTTKYYARNYIIPEKFQAEPPRPTNPKNKVKLRTLDQRDMCVRTFADWATRSQILIEMDNLQMHLKKSNIPYDAREVFVAELAAPWQVLNRTNEVAFTCSYTEPNDKKVDIAQVNLKDTVA